MITSKPRRLLTSADTPPKTNLLTVDRFTTWNFMYTTAIATGLKPGTAILQTLNYYTRCKFCAPSTSSLGGFVPRSRPFYESGWSPTVYKVWSGYFGQFMYMCVVVHCAQHRGISTTGAFIASVIMSIWQDVQGAI